MSGSPPVTNGADQARATELIPGVAEKLLTAEASEVGVETTTAL